MTRIISITMAIIIMLTAGVNSEIITASAKITDFDYGFGKSEIFSPHE